MYSNLYSFSNIKIPAVSILLYITDYLSMTGIPKPGKKLQNKRPMGHIAH